MDRIRYFGDGASHFRESFSHYLGLCTPLCHLNLLLQMSGLSAAEAPQDNSMMVTHSLATLVRVKEPIPDKRFFLGGPL